MQRPASYIPPKLLRNIRRYGIALATIVLFHACSQSKIITTWKAPNIQFSKFNSFNKILVTGMVQDTSLTLRRQMEVHFAEALKQLGYNAVTSWKEFGPRGLSKLRQEETYRRLKSKEIDAVLTITLIDKKKEKQYMPMREKYYSNLYYYNRIWNYTKIQSGWMTPEDTAGKSRQAAWECILFDLATLQPLYAIQSQPFDPGTDPKAHYYAAEMITLLVKRKVLMRQPKPSANPAARAF